MPVNAIVPASSQRPSFGVTTSLTITARICHCAVVERIAVVAALRRMGSLRPLAHGELFFALCTFHPCEPPLPHTRGLVRVFVRSGLNGFLSISGAYRDGIDIFQSFPLRAMNIVNRSLALM